MLDVPLVSLFDTPPKESQVPLFKNEQHVDDLVELDHPLLFRIEVGKKYVSRYIRALILVRRT